jgi:ketosteroid isomerase-like protein
VSNANSKLVQDPYAAFGRGEIPAVLEMMTPDVRMGIVGRIEDAPFLGIHQGKADATELLARLVEHLPTRMNRGASRDAKPRSLFVLVLRVLTSLRSIHLGAGGYLVR